MIRRPAWHDRRVLFRYLLFQIPGWAAAVLGLFVAYQFGWITPPWAFGLFALLLLKDVAFYPWLRIAYEPSSLHGPESLHDAIAVVERPLEPEGRVRIGGERWRARCVEGQRLLPGDRVRVRHVEGLTLYVEPHGS